MNVVLDATPAAAPISAIDDRAASEGLIAIIGAGPSGLAAARNL